MFTLPVYSWTLSAEKKCGCKFVHCNELQKLRKQASLHSQLIWTGRLHLNACQILWDVITRVKLSCMDWVVWWLTFDKPCCLYGSSLPLMEFTVDLWTHFMAIFLWCCACDLEIKYLLNLCMWHTSYLLTPSCHSQKVLFCQSCPCLFRIIAVSHKFQLGSF